MNRMEWNERGNGMPFRLIVCPPIVGMSQNGMKSITFLSRFRKQNAPYVVVHFSDYEIMNHFSESHRTDNLVYAFVNELIFVMLQSFEACLSVPELESKEGGPKTFRGVFICAPAVLEAGPDVEVLVEYLASSDKEGGHGSQKVIVAVRQGNLLGTAFHPELTADYSQCYFLKMAREVEEGTSSSIVTITLPPDLSLLVNERSANDLPIFE